MFMNEPKGKISVVMPTGKRMESINNLSEAIKANAEATVALAKIIGNLNPGHITINGCNIITDGQSPAINVSNDDENLEHGVYHYSPTGYSEYDYGYPQSKKVEPNEEIPKCYGEEDLDQEELEDDYTIPETEVEEECCELEEVREEDDK